VIEDYQRGYNFKGRLLRPAMVKVAVAPAENADGKERD
jgi:molecular chaperone GrpE (heat shock protein)